LIVARPAYYVEGGSFKTGNESNSLKQRVRAEVLEVVDVRLDLDAVDSIDRLCVFLVEGELDIRLAELDLFEARRRIRMEEAGGKSSDLFPAFARSLDIFVSS
jgi:hypothetical protein